MKTIVVKLNLRPQWEASKGHPEHRSGAGQHSDRRLKRLKTRQSQRRAAMGEY